MRLGAPDVNTPSWSLKAAKSGARSAWATTTSALAQASAEQRCEALHAGCSLVGLACMQCERFHRMHILKHTQHSSSFAQLHQAQDGNCQQIL